MQIVFQRHVFPYGAEVVSIVSESSAARTDASDQDNFLRYKKAGQARFIDYAIVVINARIAWMHSCDRIRSGQSLKNQTGV